MEHIKEETTKNENIVRSNELGYRKKKRSWFEEGVEALPPYLTYSTKWSADCSNKLLISIAAEDSRQVI